MNCRCEPSFIAGYWYRRRKRLICEPVQSHEVIRATKSMQENDINDPTIGSRLDVDRLPAHGYANFRVSTLISAIYDRPVYDLRSLLSPG